MTRIAANGIDIEYDTFGDRNGSPLLLIMGLSSQMVAWPESFCRKLARSGHWVLRFDNRDVGLSSKMEGVGVPRSDGDHGGPSAGKAGECAVYPLRHGG